MIRLALVCKECRHPFSEVTMGVVAAHMETEHRNTDGDIELALTAWCDRCHVEAPLFASIMHRTAGYLDEFRCETCCRALRVRRAA